jgi:molybdenum cofactor biosynthesis enzyme MoaA
MPSLDDVGINDESFKSLACSGQRDAADRRARGQLGLALSDMAVTHIMAGRRDEALRILRQAGDLAPHEQLVFHNLLATLSGGKLLRDGELTTLKHRLIDLLPQTTWAADYRPLLFLPRFLNLEFVSGKCNLHCRMCVGVQDEKYPNKFEAMPVEAFESILLAAPTISGITLSSGNSDPLLHPHIERVVRFSKEHDVRLDIYTNGHPLTEARAKLFVETGAVQMLNVSLDAATPEMYRKIRGADLGRVLKNVERLQQLKSAAGAGLPWLSLSIVAMADNIHELPAFVRMAAELGAGRVNIEDLIGWEDRKSDNRHATDNPACADLLRESVELAAQLKVKIFVPEGLRRVMEASQRVAATAGSTVPVATSVADPAAQELQSCSWAEGLYVNGDASISPCCMVHDVADMGSVNDGPLQENAKYNKVKELLFSGKVFNDCTGRPCEYVQQQKALGIPLNYITDADLGDLLPRRKRAVAPVELTVNGLRPSASAAA